MSVCTLDNEREDLRLSSVGSFTAISYQSDREAIA